MLTKIVPWFTDLPDGSGRPAQYLINSDTKVASVLEKNPEIHPELIEYIDKLVPDEDKSYILAIVMGCGEFWGSNLNADYFRWDELYPRDKKAKYGYRTFMDNKIFRKHNHTDKSPYYGRVTKVVFNEKMGRVEVIYYLTNDDPANMKTLENMENGIFPQLSMGCKVPYDICTICGWETRGKREPCNHIKLKKNHIYPDGRKAMMDNIRPRFFDVSLVDIPADCTAWSVKKVASASSVKTSEKNKRIPVGLIVTNDVKEWLPGAMYASSAMNDCPDIPVKKLMDDCSPESLMHGMIMTGIKPKPKEFCAMMKKMFGEKVPDTFEPHFVDSVPLDEFQAFKNMMKRIVKSIPYIIGLKKHIEHRTVAAPRILRVVSLKSSPKEMMKEKTAEHSEVQETMNNLYFMLGSTMTSEAVKSASILLGPRLAEILDAFSLAKLKRVYDFLYGGILVSRTASRAVPSTPPMSGSADLNTYTDIMTGMPAAVSLQMFNNMTEKTAGIATYLLPPLAVGATKMYLDYKANKTGKSTPTQDLIRNNPKMMAVLAMFSPYLARQAGLKDALLMAGAGAAGYGAGQVISKVASADTPVYDEVILTSDDRDDILTKMAMMNITPQTANILKAMTAAFLTGSGLGMVVGVNPQDNAPAPTTGRQLPNIGRPLPAEYVRRYKQLMIRRGEL